MQRQPIYEALANQDGIHLPGAEARRRQSQLQVSQAIRPAEEVMPSHLTVREAFELAGKTEFHSWPVIDKRGLVGIVTLPRIEQALADGEGASRLSDLIDSVNFPHVHADHPLYVALERMGAAKLDVLPVVSRANVHHLLGVVTLQDVLNSYGVSGADSPWSPPK
jgi:CIC family chloride channel protein